MSEFLFQYHKVHAATWAYLSSLLMLGLFFRFSRFWSVRNFDLVLLILLAPGLLLVNYGRESQATALLPANPAPQPTTRYYDPEPTATDAAPAPARPGELRSGSPPANESVPPANPDSSSSQDQPADSPATPASPTELGSSSDAETTSESNSPTKVAAAVSSDATDEASAPPPRPDEQADAELAAARTAYDKGLRAERIGFYWLLGTIGIFLIRLLLDPTMVRRPLLEPNLSTGGMIFLGCSLFVFLMANVVTSEPTDDDMQGAIAAQRFLDRSATPAEPPDLRRHGPGYALLSLLPSIPTVTILKPQTTTESPLNAFAIVAKVMALLSHLAVVLGIIAVGYRHFENFRMGVGAATLYLLLPYTSIMTGRVDHVLPAALLVWAVLCYRRPLLAGIFIGLATGVVYYPIFLLPLWFSFYRQRGVWRFAGGLFATLMVMTLSLGLVSDSWSEFWLKVQAMFGLWLPVQNGLEGVWGLSWDPVYRLPVLAAFIVLSCTLAIWPARKNLGTLLSCSAALMVATQFWHGFGGGLYMGWFLPLVLLTMFRPNLEDRVALSVLGESWFGKRRVRLAPVGEAA